MKTTTYITLNSKNNLHEIWSLSMVLTTVNTIFFVAGWLSQWNGTGKFIGKDGANIKHKLFLCSFYLLWREKLRQCNFLFSANISYTIPCFVFVHINFGSYEESSFHTGNIQKEINIYCQTMWSCAWLAQSPVPELSKKGEIC